MRIFQNDSGKLPVALILVVVLVLGLGVGAFTYTKVGKKGHGKAKQEKHVELSEWALDEFIVNLADRNESRYLKVNVVLEVEGKLKSAGGHGGGGGMPEEAKVRDMVIGVLSRKRYSDLLSEAGKDNLKTELKEALNEVLANNKVVHIYFTSFAMQ